MNSDSKWGEFKILLHKSHDAVQSQTVISVSTSVLQGSGWFKTVGGILSQLLTHEMPIFINSLWNVNINNSVDVCHHNTVI